MGQCPTWWLPCRIKVAPSVQRCKVWLMPATRVPCSNAAKKRNPLKFAGVPQTRQQISAFPKFTILSGHVEEVWLLNKFFFDCPYMPFYCLNSEDIARQSCAMVPKWRLFASYISSEPHAGMQHISDLHSKFALGPHLVWKYGRHPICGRWD